MKRSLKRLPILKQLLAAIHTLRSPLDENAHAIRPAWSLGWSVGMGICPAAARFVGNGETHNLFQREGVRRFFIIFQGT
jgi:hypothetical protein